jgi:glycosyltransferase involved in cell wall biosynthesis
MSSIHEVETPSPALTAGNPVPVLHLIHSMAYGGVETVVLNWLANIDRTRFTPYLACFANPGGTEQPFVEAARRAGFEVAQIPWSRRKPVFQSARALRSILDRHKIEILHTHNTYADLVGLIAARHRPVRTLTTLYVWSKFNWKRNLLQRFNRHLLRYFDLVSAHCEITYQQTLGLGVPADRLKLLICGFDAPRAEVTPEERRRNRAILGASQDDMVLINVARLYPEKEHGWLLEIFRQVRERCPRARLWIAGVGPLEQELRSRCTALGLDGAVSFLGFRTDLPELLALADIHVNTSSTEGVPLAICSAMAAELPIVATDVGGLPEILNKGNAGKLVPWGATEEFIAAIEQLIQSQDERTRLGCAARQFIERDYSLSTAVRGLEQTYSQLVKQCA